MFGITFGIQACPIATQTAANKSSQDAKSSIYRYNECKFLRK
jgi:hypothetical protein